MNEPTVIQRAQQGSDDAWLTLVRQHQDALFRLAYLLMGDEQIADDIVQETLIRAYRGLAGFDSTRPLRPWLLQIVRNTARNHRRAGRRYLAALQRWWHDEGENAQSIPAPSLSTHADQLWQAVRQLSQADQEIIYLRYFLELPVAEVAATLTIAEGTVKSRLSRALSRLRTVVEREYPTLQEEAHL